MKESNKNKISNMNNNKSCLRILTSKEISGHGGISGLLLHDTRENIWKDQEIKDELRENNCIKIIKDPAQSIKEIEHVIKQKTGRKRQEKAMPIREAVMELPYDFDKTRMQEIIDVANAVACTPIKRSVNETKMVDGKKTMVCEPLLDSEGNQIESPLGIKLIAVMFHADEGHWTVDGEQSAGLRKEDGQWVDINGETHDPINENLVWRPHNHAHLWYDFIDHDTGKTIKASADELSQIQDIVAEGLHMERGERNSRRVRLSQEEYNRKKILEANLVQTEHSIELNEQKIKNNSAVIKNQVNDYNARKAGIEAMRAESERLSSEVSAKEARLSSLPSGYALYRESVKMIREDVDKLMGDRYPGRLGPISFRNYEGCYAVAVERVSEDIEKTTYLVSQTSDDIHVKLPSGKIIQGEPDKNLSSYFRRTDIPHKPFPRLEAPAPSLSPSDKKAVEKELVFQYNSHHANSKAVRASFSRGVTCFSVRYQDEKTAFVVVDLLDGHAIKCSNKKQFIKRLDPKPWAPSALGKLSTSLSAGLSAGGKAFLAALDASARTSVCVSSCASGFPKRPLSDEDMVDLLIESGMDPAQAERIVSRS